MDGLMMKWDDEQMLDMLVQYYYWPRLKEKDIVPHGRLKYCAEMNMEMRLHWCNQRISSEEICLHTKKSA